MRRNSGSVRQFPGGAQFRRPGPRVGGHLGGAGSGYSPADRSPAGPHQPADVVGRVRDAGVAVQRRDGQVGLGVEVDGVEVALDDAVLERVEADGHAEAGGPQQQVRGAQTGVELVQLVVDEDAQRLERLGGTVRHAAELVAPNSTPITRTHARTHARTHTHTHTHTHTRLMALFLGLPG